MPGDLRQVPRVALTLTVQLRAELAHNFTDSYWVKHVVFNIHNDYVTLQEQDFRVPKRVADEQHPWTIPKWLEQPVLQLFIHALARGYEIRVRQAAKTQAGSFD
jgi:hypothetical protein